jgi:peptidoglycan/xylan/chitin deacetylase (PgdA/CDA1 family)
MFRWILLQLALFSSLVFPKPSLPAKPVALTFDADMTQGMFNQLKSGQVASWYNKDVIDVLEKDKVPATIFVTGLWAEAYPAVTKELFDNPLFEIGNHSYSHPKFTSDCYNLPAVGNRDLEFKKGQETLKNITGAYPKLFRFPGGCFLKSDLEIAKKYNLKVIGWDVASGDAFNSNTQSIINRVEHMVKPGSIIVMHLSGGANAPATAKALPEIISYLRSKGFTFVKVSQLGY